VDDDFRVREAIMSLVESAGYASQVFSSAREVLDSGTLAAASCLITDLRMPEIDGMELQRRVRLFRHDLPIIFISAHGDAAIRKQALAEGAVEFLSKPFDVTELLETIDRVTKRSADEEF
jgi:FixJ family two-component response regulator